MAFTGWCLTLHLTTIASNRISLANLQTHFSSQEICQFLVLQKVIATKTAKDYNSVLCAMGKYYPEEQLSRKFDHVKDSRKSTDKKKVSALQLDFMKQLIVQGVMLDKAKCHITCSAAVIQEPSMTMDITQMMIEALDQDQYHFIKKARDRGQ